MRTTPLLLGLAAIASCGGYRAGSFATSTGRFPGERRTVGCLDIAIEPVQDALASGVVAGFTFANRCDHAVAVDVPAIGVVARTRAGNRVALQPYDPRSEIRRAQLEARSIAAETIEYQVAGEQPAVVEVCLDMSRIDAEAPSAEPVVVCIANTAGVGPDAAVATP